MQACILANMIRAFKVAYFKARNLLQVADITVRTTAQMMVPYAQDFFPPSYATPEQIRKTLNVMASMI